MGLCAKCGAVTGLFRRICASCREQEEKEKAESAQALREQIAFDQKVYVQPALVSSSGFGFISGIQLPERTVVDEVDGVPIGHGRLRFLVLNPGTHNLTLHLDLSGSEFENPYLAERFLSGQRPNVEIKSRRLDLETNHQVFQCEVFGQSKRNLIDLGQDTYRLEYNLQVPATNQTFHSSEIHKALRYFLFDPNFARFWRPGLRLQKMKQPLAVEFSMIEKSKEEPGRYFRDHRERDCVDVVNEVRASRANPHLISFSKFLSLDIDCTVKDVEERFGYGSKKDNDFWLIIEYFNKGLSFTFVRSNEEIHSVEVSESARVEIEKRGIVDDNLTFLGNPADRFLKAFGECLPNPFYPGSYNYIFAVKKRLAEVTFQCDNEESVCDRIKVRWPY